MYGYLGSLRTRPGHRDDVVAILLDAAGGVQAAGCSAYIVTVSETDDDVIWVFEIWPGKDAHDASLQLPQAREAIGRAMPMLTGEFTSQEVTVVGGLGLPTG